jgi:hypothetical protein
MSTILEAVFAVHEWIDKAFLNGDETELAVILRLTYDSCIQDEGE